MKKVSLNHSGLQDDLRNIMKLTMNTFLEGSISSSSVYLLISLSDESHLFWRDMADLFFEKAFKNGFDIHELTLS